MILLYGLVRLMRLVMEIVGMWFKWNVTTPSVPWTSIKEGLGTEGHELSMSLPTVHTGILMQFPSPLPTCRVPQSSYMLALWSVLPVICSRNYFEKTLCRDNTRQRGSARYRGSSVHVKPLPGQDKPVELYKILHGSYFQGITQQINFINFATKPLF